MKVTIFGSGYVGLVQGAVLAEVGHDVVCVDVNQQRIDDLKKGIVPIYEPGLDALIERNHREGRLNFTTDADRGVSHGQIQFIAVGTPPDEDGSADLQYVLSVAETIGTYMTESKVIVDKSTVPVGTADKVTDKIASMLAERNMVLDFEVVSNPEFLKEGAAVNDCMRPDRIILGTASDKAESQLRELYAPFNRNHEKIIVMDVRSAELTKYAANCFLATKISFMNEMANLAEKLGADVEMVRQGIGSDPRIGYHFIYPGCGYGGSCFPKDVQALIRTANEVDHKPHILEAVESVNARQKTVMFRKLMQYFDENVQGKTFALWGLSFKPNTDDMREAPSRVLIEALLQAGARIKAYDPQAIQEARRIFGDSDELIFCEHKEDALAGADGLLICTEWQEFRAMDFEVVRSSLTTPLVVDGRNLYDPVKMAKESLIYLSIGR